MEDSDDESVSPPPLTDRPLYDSDEESSVGSTDDEMPAARPSTDFMQKKDKKVLRYLGNTKTIL